MTFHIITVLTQGARLSADRGFLVCSYPDQTENRIALADVRGIVIGNPSVSFTNECLARLLAQDSVILHCDKQFKPIGWTMPLDRVIRREVFLNQIAQNSEIDTLLWKQIIKQKMLNQAAVIDNLQVEHDLYRLIPKPLANEANVSRRYWHHYFKAIGNQQKRERKGAESFENRALNYGYAVISTLVHRAILIHGLLPSLGVHHEPRYRSHPLVYDLMEPFRSFVELGLVRWIKSQSVPISDNHFPSWIKYLMHSLRACRIKHPEDKHSRKLMDSIDYEVRSIATCFESKYFNAQDFSPLWLPMLRYHYWFDEQEDVLEEDNTESQNIAV